MVYRNIKTGAEIISNSVILAPGFVLVKDDSDKAASVEESEKCSSLNKEPPIKKEAPIKEQPKKKTSAKKKGTKK